MADHPHHHHEDEEQRDRLLNEQLDTAGKSLTGALQVSFTILKIIMVVLIVFFILSGIFQVQPDEQALLLRFGKLQGPAENPVIEPGFEIAFPEPIDEVIRIPVTKVQTMEINSFWYFETPQERLNPDLRRRVTGPLDPTRDGYSLTRNDSLAGLQGTDYNIVHSRWSIAYRIHKPVLFFENVYMRQQQPGEDFLEAASETVEPLLESLASNAIVTTMVYYTIDEAVKSVDSIAQDVEASLQRQLDEIQSGILISDVRADRIIWPRQVDEAFQASNRARQESEQTRVDARSYREKLLTDTGGPNAEAILEELKGEDLTPDEQEAKVTQLSGQVQSKIAAARAYRTRVVSDAKANADYLRELLPQYKEHPELVLQDIYQRAIAQVMDNVDEKIVIQPSVDGKPREIRILINRDPNIRKQQTQETNQNQ
jgi:membrane protease subunit HflK